MIFIQIIMFIVQVLFSCLIYIFNALYEKNRKIVFNFTKKGENHAYKKSEMWERLALGMFLAFVLITGMIMGFSIAIHTFQVIPIDVLCLILLIIVLWLLNRRG